MVNVEQDKFGLKSKKGKIKAVFSLSDIIAVEYFPHNENGKSVYVNLQSRRSLEFVLYGKHYYNQLEKVLLATQKFVEVRGGGKKLLVSIEEVDVVFDGRVHTVNGFQSQAFSDRSLQHLMSVLCGEAIPMESIGTLTVTTTDG